MSERGTSTIYSFSIIPIVFSIGIGGNSIVSSNPTLPMYSLKELISVVLLEDSLKT